MDRHTQMEIFIQGLVLFRLVQKVSAGRLRAYPKRISYKMILSKIQYGPGRAVADFPVSRHQLSDLVTMTHFRLSHSMTLSRKVSIAFDDSFFEDFGIELENFLKKILEEFCNKFIPFSFFLCLGDLRSVFF